MDGRQQLRRYLEQRREAGERELVLDSMPVDEVLRLLGARAAAHPPAPSDAPREAAAPPVPSASTDWRAVLAAADREASARAGAIERDRATPPTRGAPPSGSPSTDPALAGRGAMPPAAPSSAIPTVREEASQPPAGACAERWPTGLAVGTAAAELFGGALSGLATLDQIAQAVAACTKCPLYATATQAVPGEGSPTASLVCVGEAPGATEDATGRPFVGQAGKLLDKILAAIGLRREEVFICNVLKHRPPGNRNPLPDEVTACSPYLVRQLELIRPKVVVAFGTYAAQTLLQTKDSIGKLRGAVHRYYGVPLIVTYHPAALLRNPAWKRPTWEDVQYARRILDGTGV